MNPLTQPKTSVLLLLIGLLLPFFALLPTAQAVVPPPDGGYGAPRYGSGNTAEGDDALFNLDTGQFNTAIGVVSLFSLVDGMFNTGVGAGTLMANTANDNTATGAAALMSNTIGTDNTADGFQALNSSIDGNNNTAMGSEALFSNTDGGFNTAVGTGALFSNTIGNYNTAIGQWSLFTNSGGGNTALGVEALYNNTTGLGNTAVGDAAGFDVTDANHVICIGSFGGNVSFSTWIANVFGVTTQNATTAPVIVSADGQLGTVVSSERFKKDIATMEKASDAILSLRPVTFQYKTDTKNTPQFGLIAEEVAKVNPALVLPDKEGKPYSVRYEAVNAMLLNEFLKEHRKVEQLERQVQALTAGLEKVSAQLEASKPAPQVVENNE